jgi:hypothetical protein
MIIRQGVRKGAAVALIKLARLVDGPATAADENTSDERDVRLAYKVVPLSPLPGPMKARALRIRGCTTSEMRSIGYSAEVISPRRRPRRNCVLRHLSLGEAFDCF